MCVYVDDTNNEILRILYAFMGRLFYRLKSHDNFQKVLTILGDSATGKTRLIKFFEEAIGTENVSVIGNETETRFGLQSHCNSFLCILEEMSRSAKLSQSNWLNMGNVTSNELCAL